MAEAEPSSREGGAGGGGYRPSRDRGYDPTPLLRHQPDATRAAASRSLPLLIGPATTRLLMRPSSMAGPQRESRHGEWGYAGPVVALDLVWSLAFVLVSCAVLVSTARERPATPIRAWVFGYALHCLVHVGFVCFEYQRRQRSGSDRWMAVGDDDGDEDGERSEESRQSRIMKRLESVNAVISFLWWILGFYWIVVGGQALPRDAPRLYWLTVVFLAFDVFFAIFCIILACIVGIALCCCLPCVAVILSAVAGQEGASCSDLNSLPRFRFRKADQLEPLVMDEEQAVAITITQNCDSTADISLSSEDCECCICLSQYEEGVELHSLPCSHHFHSGCIIKWLRINATCPLCKYNILEGEEQV